MSQSGPALTDDELAGIEERAAAATPGPWHGTATSTAPTNVGTRTPRSSRMPVKTFRGLSPRFAASKPNLDKTDQAVDQVHDPEECRPQLLTVTPATIEDIDSLA
jgi:hypothetical protein